MTKDYIDKQVEQIGNAHEDFMNDLKAQHAETEQALLAIVKEADLKKADGIKSDLRTKE